MMSIDMLGMEKEHADWIRHAAFDQVRQFYHGNKEITLADLMREAATVADFFMDGVKPGQKPSAEVIPLTVVKRENDDAALERFRQRYDADQVQLMTDEQWRNWVDALPPDEFKAMIALGQQPEASDE